MKGKIIKGIAGFYYVHVSLRESSQKAGTLLDGGNVYECKAKGIFRRNGIKPLVGDDVELEVLDEEKGIGNIIEIYPRTNALIRPAVANIDQALVIFAIKKPDPDFHLLDRFLIMMEKQDIPCIICFNKQDIASDEEKQELIDSYGACGYQVLFVSAKEKQGIEELRALLCGKTTTVAGPSGAGKSSLVNELTPGAFMETGEISKKIERGKQTTRHAELVCLMENSYICDTPGFSSLEIMVEDKADLQQYYPEFAPYEPFCKFAGCSHIAEPKCGIKEALEAGKISRLRYQNYCQMYEELRNRKKY